MKKALSAAALVLTGLMATSAMAAPDRHDDRRYGNPPPPPAHMKHQDSRWDNGRNQHWNNNQNGWNNQRVNPSREWRSGQNFPSQFSHARYKVSSNEARRLPNAGRNQQWYKVNGDYVLVNERNDRILRIIG